MEEKTMQQDSTKNTIQEISNKIEAILFWKGEPLNKKEIINLLSMDDETKAELALIENNLELPIANLKENLDNRGLCIIEIDDSFAIRTSAKTSSLIEKLQKEELNKDLGKATVETLALIIYKGPIKRSEIDNIRGVNSSYILRNLLIRGLIDKEVDSKNSRINIYKPSFELLSFLGVTEINKLENYEEIIRELNKFNDDFGDSKETKGNNVDANTNDKDNKDD